MAEFEDIDILSELPFDDPWMFEDYFVSAAPASSHEAQMKAPSSQFAFEQQKSNADRIFASPLPSKPPVTASPSLQQPPIPGSTPSQARSGRLTVEMLRQEMQDQSSPGLEIHDSATYPKTRRGRRMVCATCQKDSPISDKNDGMNCTRCFNKLLKTRGSMTPSLTPSPEKRKYNEYAVDEYEGYSPWNVSPRKQPAVGQYNEYSLWNSSQSQQPAADPFQRYSQLNVQASPTQRPVPANRKCSR